MTTEQQDSRKAEDRYAHPRSSYLCLNIEGFMRHEKFPKGYVGMFRSEGRTLEPHEALAYLTLEQAKGRKVIPFNGECGNPCKHADTGCAGFDYSGGGCDGHWSGLGRAGGAE